MFKRGNIAPQILSWNNVSPPGVLSISKYMREFSCSQLVGI